jgi:SSS family transporter
MTNTYWIDGLVIGAYFALILGIGLAQRKKSGSVEGFALGDRQIPWWAVLASILAAEISAATFLGAPGEGFANRNWTYAQLAIGTIIARVIVSVVFIPAYYKQGVVSIYEFLGNRFGNPTRKTASATFLVTRVLAMGTRLYVSAIIVVLAFELLSGREMTPHETFLLYAGAVILVTLLTALYTSIGGIRAVIWTDFIQVTILFAALGFAIWFLLGRVQGGWGTVAESIRPPVFFDAMPPAPAEGIGAWIRRILSSEYTVYSALIGSVFVTMATHGIDQDTVQRMLTAKNKQQSMVATIASGLIDLPIVCSFILVGILLGAFYAQNPNPHLPAEGREVFPFFILHEMPAGLRGLVAAGILSTAMGSLSTALNALATSFSHDFIFKGIPSEATERSRVRVLRLSTVGFALLVILVGVATAYYSSVKSDVRIIPLVLGILGFTFGSILGIFLVAIFTKTRGNNFGNILAMFLGFVAVLFLSNADLQKTTGFVRPGVSILAPTGSRPEARTVVEPADPRTLDRSAEPRPAPLPFLILAFPWRITAGTLVTVAVALCFKTPKSSR